MRSTLVLASSFAIVGLARVAEAQEPTSESKGRPWRDVGSTVQLYGFLPLTIDATTTVGDRSVEFEADAGDVLDKLEAGAAGRFEVWNQQTVGFVVDFLYLRVGQDGDVRGVPFDVDTRQLTADFTLAVMPLRNRYASLKLLGGLRTEFKDSSLEIAGLERSSEEREIRLAGGAEVPLRFTEHWGARARAVVAGPDGTSVTALGVGEYDFGPVTFALGYRYDRIDSEGERVSLDAHAHSVYLSVTMGFGMTSAL